MNIFIQGGLETLDHMLDSAAVDYRESDPERFMAAETLGQEFLNRLATREPRLSRRNVECVARESVRHYPEHGIWIHARTSKAPGVSPPHAAG